MMEQTLQLYTTLEQLSNRLVFGLVLSDQLLRSMAVFTRIEISGVIPGSHNQQIYRLYGSARRHTCISRRGRSGVNFGRHKILTLAKTPVSRGSWSMESRVKGYTSNINRSLCSAVSTLLEKEKSRSELCSIHYCNCCDGHYNAGVISRWRPKPKP